MKDSKNGKKPTRTPKIQILDLRARKLGGSNMDWSNPFGD
jgi:hypothetical protein